MSDRDAFREARTAAKVKLHEKRLENATYTAAEVKVLTETASKVAYALGRKDAGEEIAEAINQARIARKWNFIALAAAGECSQIAREVTSQAPGAASDATSGVPGHQEVSEAVRSPQEPCGHPTCPCAQEAR